MYVLPVNVLCMHAYECVMKSYCRYPSSANGKIYALPLVMWRQLIKENGGQVTAALDLSSLAKISDGYTQGHMVQVVRSILTERRVQQLAKRPLSAAEFVAPLAKIDPVFQDEEEALKVNYEMFYT